MRLTGKYRYLTFEDRKKIEALQAERLKINGFYPDWAIPPLDFILKVSIRDKSKFKTSAKGTAQSSPRGGCVRASSAEVNEHRPHSTATEGR